MERKPFKLKSGNKTSFKMMGSTEKESPAKFIGGIKRGLKLGKKLFTEPRKFMDDITEIPKGKTTVKSKNVKNPKTIQKKIQESYEEGLFKPVPRSSLNKFLRRAVKIGSGIAGGALLYEMGRNFGFDQGVRQKDNKNTNKQNNDYNTQDTQDDNKKSKFPRSNKPFSE